LNRTEKEQFMSDLTKGVGGAQAIALMSFNKLTVEQMTLFRLELRKKNVRVKVLKNTLAKRVFADTPYKSVTEHLQGPTLLAYSDTDPVLASKAIMEWVGKENFDLKVKSGAALGQMMSSEQLKALSKLPGKNELFVGFLWALKSPPTKFLYALQDTPRKLGYALVALRDHKQKAS
jgi:large subunit ribosomal protein L10